MWGCVNYQTKLWKRISFINLKRPCTTDVSDRNNYNLYQNTLNLPKTKFSLRANALQNEPKLQQICCDYLYKHQLENNQQTFVLHDGPPYANGLLHLGHALNKILKDIVCRYKVLRGYRVHYVPGWDCHGLPIELKVLQKYKDIAKDPVKLRKTAKQFVLDTIEKQKKEFKRFGVMGDWENFYTTMDPKYEASQLEVFLKMFLQGYIYRGFRPVYWSPSSRTALAEAELEYNENHVSKSIFVEFPVKKYNENLSRFKNLSAVIWTTTPWTVVANQAICYHKGIDYKIIQVQGEKHFIIADKLLPSFSEKTGIQYKIVASIKGEELDGLVCKHPLYNRDSPLLHGDHVTTSAGTGLVHTAPGHGHEDFEIGKRYNLEIQCPVNDEGRFTDEIKEFAGMNVLKEGNDAVIDALKENILHIENYTHKYPYDWRTKKPIIIRCTKQWFAQLENIKPLAQKEIENIKMIPESARRRLQSFVGERSEWCISRQRVWGVPIPVFYTDQDEVLATSESIEYVISLVRKYGSDCWWSLPTEELLAPQYRNNGIKYTKGTDTLDVWFDSGTSWYSVLKERGIPLPADVYLEGSDQHRGWFQSSLLTSVSYNGKAPYKTVITHGFILDENYQKMSKSLGNVIDPSTIIYGGKNKQLDPPYGADILRLWITSADYTSDLVIGKTVLEYQTRLFTKIRSTLRYCLGNLSGFDGNLEPYNNLLNIDKYFLNQLYHFCNKITYHYDNFEFNKVYQTVKEFIYVDISAIYFDIIKDRLYAEATNSKARRAAQTTLYYTLNNLTKAIAPILCHTAEDCYQYNPFKNEKSIFTTGWMIQKSEWDNKEISKTFELLLDLKSEVYKLIEKARANKVYGSSLEVCVELHISSPELNTALNSLSKEEIEDILIVSEVHFLNSIEDKTGYYAKVNKSDGDIEIRLTKPKFHKCHRCWKFTAEEDLCLRCKTVLSN